MRTKRERAITWWNPTAQTRPIHDSSSFVPIPTLPCKLANILLLAFLLFELVAALSQCCVQKATRRMEKSMNTHNGLRYFLTNEIFLLQITYKRERKYTVNVQCTLLNVGNAVLCVIYQLNFTIFMYVRWMCYIMLYIVFGNIRDFI